MRKKGLFLVFAVLLLGVADATASPVDPMPAVTDPIDVETECESTDTAAPEHHELPLIGDYETRLDFDVHVALFKIDQAIARGVMDQVVESFGALAIDVNLTYETVDLKVEPYEGVTSEVLVPAQFPEYLQATKDYFGGRPPAHADAVYMMSGTNIGDGQAGQADCVGGIAQLETSFAIGVADWSTPDAEITSGRIATHELAHLFAAHHHFAACPGNTDDLVNDRAPCTVMFPSAGLISRTFSPLEAAVVRRWALDYLAPGARPAPAPEPEPEPRRVDRSITLEVNEKRTGRGSIASSVEDADSCIEGVPVALERRNRAAGWKRIVETEAGPGFRFPIDRPGVYRTVADELILEDGETVCAEATSRQVRVR